MSWLNWESKLTLCNGQLLLKGVILLASLCWCWDPSVLLEHQFGNLKNCNLFSYAVLLFCCLSYSDNEITLWSNRRKWGFWERGIPRNKTGLVGINYRFCKNTAVMSLHYNTLTVIDYRYSILAIDRSSQKDEGCFKPVPCISLFS